MGVQLESLLYLGTTDLEMCTSKYEITLILTCIDMCYNWNLQAQIDKA